MGLGRSLGLPFSSIIRYKCLVIVLLWYIGSQNHILILNIINTNQRIIKIFSKNKNRKKNRKKNKKIRIRRIRKECAKVQNGTT